MTDISIEAKKAGLNEPVKDIEEMTEEELMAFRNSFNPDMMGFDGTEGIEDDAAEQEGYADEED